MDKTISFNITPEEKALIIASRNVDAVSQAGAYRMLGVAIPDTLCRKLECMGYQLDEGQEPHKESFFEWYHYRASEEEKELVDKVGSFEELFDDMLFKEGSSTYELLRIKSKLLGEEDFRDDIMDLPEELEYCDLMELCQYKVADFTGNKEHEGSNGYYDHKNKELVINRNDLKNDSVVLHEMIHLLEQTINDLPMYFHDMVYWSLYKDLRNKIPGLDDIITDHANALVGYDLAVTGGVHDILFLLKSFDLDIRMGYTLGTVFSYGRQDDFKEYSYNVSG